MALFFSDASNMSVSFGSGAELDDVTPGTFVAIFRSTDTTKANQFILGKRITTGAGNVLIVSPGAVGNGAIGGIINRATSNLQASAASVISDNTWYIVAFTWDVSGADADQKLFLGTMSGPIAEPSYSVQTVGSGSTTSYAAADLIAGMRSATETFSRFKGDIAWVGFWSRQLALDEVYQIRRGHMPRSGCLLDSHLWHGASGSQIDYSPHRNHGTVSGSVANAAHAPILSPFAWRHQEDDAYIVAAGGGGFQSAWARGSNILLGAGA